MIVAVWHSCAVDRRQAGNQKTTGLFDVTKWEPTGTFAPDCDVAPTKDVHVFMDRPVRDSGSPDPVRRLRVLRWGLVPSWAKTPDMGVSGPIRWAPL